MLKTRGYNTILLPWGAGFPNNLRPTAGAPPLTFEQFCSNLEEAGVTRLRVKVTGMQNPQQTGTKGFEYQFGKFNDWEGRLEAMVTACKRHHVGIQALPFESFEFVDGWHSHPWNVRNGGPLSEPRAVFTSPVALTAAKRRIDAIVAQVGDVIVAWELCAEMRWMMNPGFLQTTWEEMPRVVQETVVPWVEEMVQYIKSKHDASVGNGQVRDLGGKIEFVNEIYRTPSLDFALINWYGAGSVAQKVQQLRAAQAYVGKPVYVEQYAPWNLGADAGYTPEPPNLSESKEHEWAAACGEYGMVGPSRWPEIRPKGEVQKWWGIAHPNLAAIAGVTRKMSAAVDLSDWDGRGAARDGRVQSPDLSLKSTWGDGRHLTAFLKWSSVGGKQVTVGGMADGKYDVRWFDYIQGDQIEKRTATASSGTLNLGSAVTRQRCAAVCVTPLSGGPLPDPELEKRVEALEQSQAQQDARLDQLETEMSETLARLDAGAKGLAGG